MAADNTGSRASMANQCDRKGSRRRQTVESRRQLLPEPRSDSPVGSRVVPAAGQAPKRPSHAATFYRPAASSQDVTVEMLLASYYVLI